MIVVFVEMSIAVMRKELTIKYEIEDDMDILDSIIIISLNDFVLLST